MLLILPACAEQAVTFTPEGQDYAYEDRPEVLSVLKAHVTYIGEFQQARMDGVIRYIDCISNGAGVQELKWIKEDYLVSASSVPLIYTSAEINEMRKEMSRQAELFSFTYNTLLGVFNGNSNDMEAYINDSFRAHEEAALNASEPSWLTFGTGRMIMFNRSAEYRQALLEEMQTRGIDISDAQKISEGIAEERYALEGILTSRSNECIIAFNGRIRIETQKFRDVIRGYREELRIQEMTASMKAIK
jgi:hypothetical protein